VNQTFLFRNTRIARTQEEVVVQLFRYVAGMSDQEEYTESGTILAHSEEEAKKKLRALHFDQIRLKRVTGLRGVVGRLTATIR
jgi:hypothetical protein